MMSCISGYLESQAIVSIVLDFLERLIWLKRFKMECIYIERMEKKYRTFSLTQISTYLSAKNMIPDDLKIQKKKTNKKHKMPHNSRSRSSWNLKA